MKFSHATAALAFDTSSGITASTLENISAFNGLLVTGSAIAKFPVPEKQAGPGGSTWSQLVTESFTPPNGGTSYAGNQYASGNQIAANAPGTTWTQSADGVQWTANASPITDPNPANSSVLCTQTLSLAGSIKTASGTLTITNVCPVNGTEKLLSDAASSIGSFMSSAETTIANDVQAAANWVGGILADVIEWASGADERDVAGPTSYGAEQGLGYVQSNNPIGHETYLNGHLSFH